MAAPQPPLSFSPHAAQTPPRQAVPQRLNRRTVMFLLMAVLGIVTVLFFVFKSQHQKRDRLAMPPPSETEATGTVAPFGDLRDRVTSYEHLTPVPTQPPPRQPGAPTQAQTTPPANPFTLGPSALPPRPNPPPQ